jgi:O-acetyl-ADP-ribose deacetylase (regulator of RNase III)
MITYRKDNIFASEAEALVNPVNCVGVMGAGLAVLFKRYYPDNFAAYVTACRSGNVSVGIMFAFKRMEKTFEELDAVERALRGPTWIINFPTKQHWRDPSRTKWIIEGLANLAVIIKEQRIFSVAVPALGCGNGGLDYLKQVRPMIEMFAQVLDDIGVNVYAYEDTAR